MNIIISNRTYRSILLKLKELEECLKKIRPDAEKEAMPTEQIDHEKVNFGEQYIDGEKVCELLCISGRTLLRLGKTHQFKSTMVSHRRYYPLSEIEKLFVQRSIAFSREIRERLKCEFKRLKGVDINENFCCHELS